MLGFSKIIPMRIRGVFEQKTSYFLLKIIGDNSLSIGVPADGVNW